MTSAIILAGGLGTRLRSTVPDLPKPMAPINGRPFLEYQLDFWINQGVTDFILSVGYRWEAITDHFGDRYHGARIRYSREETPLGTGGGMLIAMDLLATDAPFLLLNGDTLFEIELATLARFHQDNQSDWTLALFRTEETGRYMGVDISQDGRILSLANGELQGERQANGGVYLVNPALFKAIDCPRGVSASLENDLIPQAMKTGARLFGLEFERCFIDIGLPHDYLRASDFVASMGTDANKPLA